MVAKTGVNSLTYERIVMGPGAVYINDVLLGATKGGNVMEINRVFRDIRPDGALGKVKGFRYLESVECTLTVKLVEITESAIIYALAGSSTASPHIVTGGEIVAGTYITKVSIVAEMKGVTSGTEMNAVEVAISNALVEGPLTVNLPESGEAVVELKFHGHFAATTLHTEPWTLTFTHVPA